MPKPRYLMDVARIQDISKEIDTVYYLLMSVLVTSGLLMIISRNLGRCLGVLGASIEIWSDYNRYNRSLKRNP